MVINNLSILALNVCSIKSLGRRAFLHDILEDKNPFFAFISETRLKPIHKVIIDCYKITRNDNVKSISSI
jgi:hypothetical protein